jgi:serine/threonine protein kinase
VRFKTVNILIDEHYQAKISDFGFSRMLNRTEANSYHGHSGETGTYVQMPSEVMKGVFIIPCWSMASDVRLEDKWLLAHSERRSGLV